jgi:hypothetical protein
MGNSDTIAPFASVLSVHDVTAITNGFAPAGTRCVWVVTTIALWGDPSLLGETEWRWSNHRITCRNIDRAAKKTLHARTFDVTSTFDW